MRAALLPAGADPFLVEYWLRHAATWQDQVDELRVHVYGVRDRAVRKYLRSLVRGNVVMRIFSDRVDHGRAIERLVRETGADTVMLCEDDAFVRRPAIIDEMFRLIEDRSVDLVGCPRGSASPELILYANSALGEQRADNGEEGPLFWPCFLFAWRSDLLRTSMRFGAHAWDVNERITGTARLASEVQAADTFGLASLELRELGLRVRIMPQYRARPDMANWQNAPWFHVGSLSAGYGMYLVGDQESLDSMYASIRDDLFDWDKRMAWWQRVTDEGDGLPHKREEYRAAIAAFMAGTGQSQANVDTWRRSFDGLISWT